MLWQASSPEQASTVDSGSFFHDLFEVYVPRRQCMYNDTSVVWLHVVSDTLIATAYFSIPIALLYFLRRRRDLQFSWIFAMFAAFILLCGTTHIFGVWAIWQPLYKIDGLVKLVTAIASMATAIYLWKLIPIAIALPSPAELRAANAHLEHEIGERKKAQEAQSLLQRELENRVGIRTRELAERNLALQAENAARLQVERERNELLVSERSARHDAERANRTKDEFLATLSHELRTPLNAMQGWSQILRREGVTQRELDQGLEVIERNARIQTELIEDLLDVSRVLSGGLRLDVKVVDLPQVVRASVESIAPTAAAKQVHVEMVLDPRATPVSGDPNRLQQIVWNLLSNSVKFTPEGGRVAVSLKRVDSHAEIEISDTGVGIEAEFMPQLFERFRQSQPTTTRSSGGLGLGLSIVRQLIDLHGGTVSAHSDGRGKGATFVVRLPLLLHTVVPSHGDVDRSSEDKTRERPDLRGARVLVVDDEPDSRQVVRHMLEVCGADVVMASSGEEGLLSFDAHLPHVIVSDLGMPGIDGHSFIQSIRERSPEKGGRTPAVAVTAMASLEDRRRALQSGFQLHIAKPVDPDELAAVVARLIDGTHLTGSNNRAR
jgi:signal transduction histidine kinase/ActR/RegA family two-component response regulator